MKYLESYQLFEAETRQEITDEIVNALENTPEGRDLLALASREFKYSDHIKKTSRYTARRTGRVEINNLRGRTYITQLDNGKWYHAVEATGRRYGEGYYDTLRECIRGVWRDFILESTSIVPMGMPRKMHKEIAGKELPNLAGKGFTQNQIREHLRGLYAGGNQMMDSTSPIFSSPRWKQIFDFLGLEKLTRRDDTGSWIEIQLEETKKSVLEILSIALIPPPEENNFNFGSTAFGITPTNVYRDQMESVSIKFLLYIKKMTIPKNYRFVKIEIGDTIEKCKEVETIASKKLIENNLPKEDLNPNFWGGNKISEDQEKIRKLIINFALEVFAKGTEGEDKIEINNQIFFESIAPRIKKTNPSPAILSKIRGKIPGLWEIYKSIDSKVASGNDTMADLGDLGF